eukprot:4146255-Pyramimonas_sp.AAC.1
MHALLMSLMTLALQNTQKIILFMCAVAGTWTMPVAHPLLAHISDELDGGSQEGQRLQIRAGQRGTTTPWVHRPQHWPRRCWRDWQHARSEAESSS